MDEFDFYVSPKEYSALEIKELNCAPSSLKKQNIKRLKNNKNIFF